MASTKSLPARANDFKYDPLFVVSGEKDYYKAAMIAKLSTAKFAICPIFPSMFSDLPHQPRQQILMRRTSGVPPPYVDRSQGGNVSLEQFFTRPVDVHGCDRFKFFHCAKIDLNPTDIPSLAFHPNTPRKKTAEVKKKRNRKIQTQYRESSVQTIPWQPPDYIVMDEENGKPELLMLDFLKWGSGLPAGVHEVQLIERARMKRAWEKAMPPITDASSLNLRRDIIGAMERDEWAFREQEIQDIHNLRMELLEKMLNELHEKSKTRTEEKVQWFYNFKQLEKKEKLDKLRYKANRELRKLEMKHIGFNPKYHVANIVHEHTDRKSEIYGPLMRHGEHPKRWHQVIDQHLKKYRAQFIGVEDFSTLPRWIDQATKMKECIKLPGTRLCIRETKWTTPVLTKLYNELKSLRQPQAPAKCTLRVRKHRIASAPPTPEIQGIDDGYETAHQATIAIQSVLRGRASQILIFEGRNRCRELIRELRSTHALQDAEQQRIIEERMEVMSQRREYTLCKLNMNQLKSALGNLSGTIVGTLLDFLNKELRRLLDERRAHAMCLIAERERRHVREAAEAGRRQYELRRRREHDEMFKQIAKVNQDTIDLYLQDIITEGMDFASTVEAKTYITQLAEKIDAETYARPDESNVTEDEEFIANLVHHFVLPEVEKQLIRERIRKKQKNALKTTHEAIYSKMERLPKWEKSPSLPVEIKIPTSAHSTQTSIQSLDEVNQMNVFEAKNKFPYVPQPSDAVNLLYDSKDKISLGLTQSSGQLSVMLDLNYKEDHPDQILARVGSGSCTILEEDMDIQQVKNIGTNLDLTVLGGVDQIIPQSPESTTQTESATPTEGTSTTLDEST